LTTGDEERSPEFGQRSHSLTCGGWSREHQRDTVIGRIASLVQVELKGLIERRSEGRERIWDYESLGLDLAKIVRDGLPVQAVHLSKREVEGECYV
jgi:hypothetical protein